MSFPSSGAECSYSVEVYVIGCAAALPATQIDTLDASACSPFRCGAEGSDYLGVAARIGS
eukprot:2216899-Pyramimonas_sp.AAC.1